MNLLHLYIAASLFATAGTAKKDDRRAKKTSAAEVPQERIDMRFVDFGLDYMEYDAQRELRRDVMRQAIDAVQWRIDKALAEESRKDKDKRS